MTKHTKKSWRDIYPVHPAADVFPMMPEDELRDLGNDIKKNGLEQPIIIWRDLSGYRAGEDTDGGGEDTEPAERRKQYVLDGRNRLDAMEKVGMRTISGDVLNVKVQHVSSRNISYKVLSLSEGLTEAEEGPGPVPDPAAYVISTNIKRRHLTKQQQAELIVKVVEASQTDSAKLARSVKRGDGGRVQGSTPDPIKAKVIEEAQKNDISPRTAERALAKQRAPGGTFVKCPECSWRSRGPKSIVGGALAKHMDAAHKTKRAFVTCPECSGRTADLDKHMATKHKSRKLQVVEDRPPKRTKKQALNSLRGIAIDVDSAAATFELACGDLSTLVTYDEAQELMDMVADGARELAAYARQFNREREALTARKGSR